MLRAQPATYLCPMNQPSERSKILLNVFVLFYAGEIQPYLAQLQRLGEPWAAADQAITCCCAHSTRDSAGAGSSGGQSRGVVG